MSPLSWHRRTNADLDLAGGIVAKTATHRFEVHQVAPKGWHLDIYLGQNARPLARITADLLSTARNEAVRLASDERALDDLVAFTPQPALEVGCLAQEPSTTCPYALRVGHRTCLSGCWTEPCGDAEPPTDGLGNPVHDPNLDQALHTYAAGAIDAAFDRRGW